MNVNWPRTPEGITNYTRTINWETGTSKETFDRTPGLNPASWKYGLGGWRHADSEVRASDAHRERQVCLAHGRRRPARAGFA